MGLIRSVMHLYSPQADRLVLAMLPGGIGACWRAGTPREENRATLDRRLGLAGPRTKEGHPGLTPGLSCRCTGLRRMAA